MISVSGGRACRDRDGVERLAGLPLRLAADVAVRVDRLGRSAALRRRGGSSTSSSPSWWRDNSEDILELTADTSPPPVASSFGVERGVLRCDDIPVYQRAIPMSSTTAEVKNISGNRSMSG